MGNDPLNIRFENTKFQSDGLRRIRWGVFDGADSKPRIAAFLVNSFEVSLDGASNLDFNVEAEATIKTDEALNGSSQQAYEWKHGHFESIDTKEQEWFKFN